MCIISKMRAWWIANQPHCDHGAAYCSLYNGNVKDLLYTVYLIDTNGMPDQHSYSSAVPIRELCDYD